MYMCMGFDKRKDRGFAGKILSESRAEACRRKMGICPIETDLEILVYISCHIRDMESNGTGMR